MRLTLAFGLGVVMAHKLNQQESIDMTGCSDDMDLELEGLITNHLPKKKQEQKKLTEEEFVEQAVSAKVDTKAILQQRPEGTYKGVLISGTPTDMIGEVVNSMHGDLAGLTKENVEIPRYQQ